MEEIKIIGSEKNLQERRIEQSEQTTIKKNFSLNELERELENLMREKEELEWRIATVQETIIKVKSLLGVK